MRSIICFFIIITFSGQIFAQSFFKPIPKKGVSISHAIAERLEILADSESVVLPAIVNAWRPVVSVVAYAEPGHLIMTGGGAGYQHLVYDATTQKYNCQYSFNAIFWAAGDVAPGPQNAAFSFGPAIGLFNNLLLFGGAYDFTNKRFIGALSLGISLNN